VFKELNLKGRTFNDIILADTKRDLLEDNIFNILQHSDRLIQRGVETNRGIMLAGPPGVGKSMTIDAIIDRGSCTVLFATFNMLHKAMKEIFQVARKYAPTILILEDIDALGITGQRGDGGSGVGLSTLLNCMDGIDSNNGVITIATSNHPEHMDWALVARPGRFDVRIDYPYPDQAMLQGILELKLSRYACEENLNLASLVKRMPHGFTGSHMQDIVNQANYISLGQTSGDAASVKITMQALKQSFERTLYNFEKFLAERPGLVFSEAERSRDHFFN
jgi:cell division protease FtsH